MRDNQFYWLFYAKVLGIETKNQLNFDFIEAVFESGLGMRPVFSHVWPEDVIRKDVFDKFFSEEERRLRRIQAGKYQIVVSPPPEWKQWLRKFDNKADFMFWSELFQSQDVKESEISAGLLD